MKKEPELSCVIITLNEEKNLPWLLESLKNQTFKDFEVIVADYNSTDKTRKIARHFGCKITQGGVHSVARNNGAKIARGNYLLFLDADSVLPKNFLAKNLAKFKKSGKGTATVKIKPMSEKVRDRMLFNLYNYWAKGMSRISPHCAGCSIFTKKDVFLALGGFDEKIVFAEDHNYAKRARRYGFIFLPVPINNSVRRLEKDGRVKFTIKYIYAGLYRMFYKEINRKIFEYD
jgi:glycosyltransferase involved in cell wall biosynthesis